MVGLLCGGGYVVYLCLAVLSWDGHGDRKWRRRTRVEVGGARGVAYMYYSRARRWNGSSTTGIASMNGVGQAKTVFGYQA